MPSKKQKQQKKPGENKRKLAELEAKVEVLRHAARDAGDVSADGHLREKHTARSAACHAPRTSARAMAAATHTGTFPHQPPTHPPTSRSVVTPPRPGCKGRKHNCGTGGNAPCASRACLTDEARLTPDSVSDPTADVGVGAMGCGENVGVADVLSHSRLPRRLKLSSSEALESPG